MFEKEPDGIRKKIEDNIWDLFGDDDKVSVSDKGVDYLPDKTGKLVWKEDPEKVVENAKYYNKKSGDSK